MFKLLSLLFALSFPAMCDITNPIFDEAFHRLYSFDFPGAQALMDKYIGSQPNDPMGYTIKAATYVYSEFDRMGILETEFFESDKTISDSRHKLKPDQKAHDEFYANINKAQALAQETLDKTPNDAPARFALCMALGELSDYVALVEKAAARQPFRHQARISGSQGLAR